MSAIAGRVNFDGRPIEPGQIEAMTSAMRRRGPAGLFGWQRGSVGLGQCMLRTTPESLEEVQPLLNEDASIALVMDGRVDNRDELLREMSGRGVVLRTRADAELVLRAYEVWGDECATRIVGELTFFIWDEQRKRLFAARDAAGTRHFYYYAGRGWFAFASEISGLLVVPGVGRLLNESRVLDYLVEAFDRSDEIGTFYKDILRLPAGHALAVTERGVQSWRYWNPATLSANRFSSPQECTEAFMEQLRLAVKCRLRSIKPVGAMLSGGLDSSSIVGLISAEFRAQLSQPLHTFSLIREDRENCVDWHSIAEILKADAWLQPNITTSAKVDQVWRAHMAGIATTDEPFAVTNGLTYRLIYDAAREAGCGVVLDGMAGDALFHDPGSSGVILAQQRRLAELPALLAAYQRHGITGGVNYFLRVLLTDMAPDRLRAIARRRRDLGELTDEDMKVLHAPVARRYLASKRSARYLAGGRLRDQNDQLAHARNFTSGLISFGHEVYGPLALANGVEPRSPFSDRRMIEFAIQMPLKSKLAIPWYKHILREGTAGLLPDAVRWRADIGGHPGWDFFERFAQRLARDPSGIWNAVALCDPLDRWVNTAETGRCLARFEEQGDFASGLRFFRLLVLSRWLLSREFAP